MESGSNIVDLSFLTKFTKGDSNKIKYFIEMYLRTAPKLFGEMDDAFNSMSNEELYSRAHSLKPQCAYVGIVGLKEILIEIEEATRNNLDRDSMQKLVKRAIELNKRGMSELNTYLEAEKVA